MKTCKKCKTEKSVSEFSKKSASKDGLQYQCKKCISVIYDAYYAANPDKKRASSAAYHAANPDKVRAQKAIYYAANADKLRAMSAANRAANPDKAAAYNAANPDKMRAASSAWNAANPEKRRIANQNRRAKKRANGGKLSPDLSAKLFKLQKGKCACCSLPLGDNFHLDHIMPLALGGSNIDSNIQLLRSTCNSQKHAKHPVNFMQSRGFLL